jgi:hypothetical protein
MDKSCRPRIGRDKQGESLGWETQGKEKYIYTVYIYIYITELKAYFNSRNTEPYVTAMYPHQTAGQNFFLI